MIVSSRQSALVLLFAVLLCYVWYNSLRVSAEIGKSDQADLNEISLNTINVKHIYQEKLLCVPTAASMIMTFYGDRQSPRKLKMMSRGKKYVASEPFTDFSITLYRDIVKAAASLGYDWSEQTLEDTESGFQRGLAIIKNEIGHKRPVMIDVSAPEGHTIVVVGFDEVERSIMVVDPHASAPGRYAIPFLELRSIWNEHAFNGYFRSLVITSARRHSPQISEP